MGIKRSHDPPLAHFNMQSQRRDVWGVRKGGGQRSSGWEVTGPI